jgi:hypothetical protein
MKDNQLYLHLSLGLSQKRNSLIPETTNVVRHFSKAAFEEGAPLQNINPLIAVAAHVTRCSYCIRGYMLQAIKKVQLNKRLGKLYR